VPEAAAAHRRLDEALAALALALALLYVPWIGGLSPVAPHHTLVERFDLPAFPSVAWLESLASVFQVAALALAALPAWPARQRWAVLGAGVALAVAYQLAIGRPSWWLYAYSFLSGAGLLAVLFFAVASFNGPHRQLARHLLGALGLFVAFGVVTRTFLAVSSAQAEPTLDWAALLLDRAAFGFTPSVWAVEAAPAGSAARLLLAIAYEVLPLAMFAVFALELRAPRRLPFGLFRGLLACGFAAALLYAITPVTGPAYALGKAFPHQLEPLFAQAPTWLATAPGQFAPRNGFPSFHLAWALMAALLCWRQPLPVRAAFGAYAALIAAATMALGEHYLVDLVAAVPVLAAIFALCIERVSWRAPARRHALAGGIALYVVWAVLLRPGPAFAAAGVPLLLPAWCALNVAAGSYWLWRLLRAWESGDAAAR